MLWHVRCAVAVGTEIVRAEVEVGGGEHATSVIERMVRRSAGCLDQRLS